MLTLRAFDWFYHYFEADFAIEVVGIPSGFFRKMARRYVCVKVRRWMLNVHFLHLLDQELDILRLLLHKLAVKFAFSSWAQPSSPVLFGFLLNHVVLLLIITAF
jgi:hypothetical protein